MMTNAIMIYFLVSMVMMGILVALFFRFHFGVADMESKITGIWSNRDDSIRVLIYNINSRIQGEVVWTDNSNDKILGTTIIRDMNLASFGWSKGVYINPLTRAQFKLKMRLKNSSKLDLRLLECEDSDDSVQRWNLVK